MDMTTPSGQLAGLSFFVLWVLMAILIFSGVRHALGAEPKYDDRSHTRGRSGGRIARYLDENDKELGAASQAIEAMAKSYFARRAGKIHLAVLAFFAVTTVFLTIWNLYEVKQRASQMQATSPSLHK
ncbi:hypothetical protein [Sinorhizobium fredii]|uniref:hypothetical protein n=1 Tax=Rhizobium fredii TaxID=380 RepID=UPI00351601E1